MIIEFLDGRVDSLKGLFADGFRGSVVFHVGDVGVGNDFSGVTVHAIAGINPEEAEVGADVWSHANRTLTQTYAQVAAVLDGTGVTIHRGDTLSLSFSGLGDVSDRTELWLSGKRNLQESDVDACLQVRETTGLERINGQAPVAGDTGQILVTDAVAGDITIVVSADATSKLLPLNSGYYDIQVMRSDGTVTTLAHGTLQIVPDVTEAIA